MLIHHHVISQVEDKLKAGNKRVSLASRKIKIRTKNHNSGKVKSNPKITITAKAT